MNRIFIEYINVIHDKSQDTHLCGCLLSHPPSPGRWAGPDPGGDAGRAAGAAVSAARSPLPRRPHESLLSKTNNSAVVTHLPRAEQLHVDELPLGAKQVLLLLKTDRSGLFLLSPSSAVCLLV